MPAKCGGGFYRTYNKPSFLNMDEGKYKQPLTVYGNEGKIKNPPPHLAGMRDIKKGISAHERKNIKKIR